MSDVLGDVVDENLSTRTLAPSAVLSQLILMTCVSVVTVLAFNILRPRNKIVYEPKVKYHVGNKQPPRISDGLFGWLPPLLHTKEDVLLDKIGLDAVTYLRFLRMLRWLFTAIAVSAAAVLIPVNVVYNIDHVPASGRDILSILTIRDVSGNILFVHVAMTYVFTFIVMGFVWWHWRAMVQLRHTWFHSPEYAESFYARTLMILRVPKKKQSDEGIRAILESMQVPYPATSVHIGRRVGRLPELIEFHNDAVRELEKVLVRYLKNGAIGKKRPTIRQGGFLGMGGVKIDAIDHWTKKLQMAESAITACRVEIDTRKPENYGFASMAAVPYAHIVARLVRNKHPNGTTISLAPNPKDIIWENLSKSDNTLARKRTIGWIYLTLICFVNTIPLLVVSFLANLASITSYVPFLEDWANASHATFVIVSGVLPSAVGSFFGFILPVAMRWLSKYQGATTHSRLDRAVVARYFAFLMISQLILFTLIGVLFNSVEQIVNQIGSHQSLSQILDNLDVLPDKINSTYINQANYWLTFFPLRGFLVVFDLAQILNLFWIWIKTRLFGRTPRDIREWTQPPDFEYAIYYSNILLMAAVGFVFAPLAPLIPIAAAIVFWLSSFVYKYQLMFVFVSKVETGGRMWNVIINRLLVTVIFMQALMVLTIGLQHGWTSYAWIASIPPIFFILGFKVYIDKTFDQQFRYYVVTDQDLRTVKLHTERADSRSSGLEKRFGHPALHTELFTPMLHAKMMPLLPQVYHGRLQSDSATLEEYGGTKAEAQVVPGGIKIAAIQQSELEYDPALYQRDRGELDWDQRSIATTKFMGGHGLHHAKSGLSAPSLHQPYGYEKYTPGVTSPDIELARMDSRADQQPLLRYAQPAASGSGYFPQNYHDNMDGTTTSPSEYRDDASSHHRLSPSGSRPDLHQQRPYRDPSMTSLGTPPVPPLPSQQAAQYPPHLPPQQASQYPPTPLPPQQVSQYPPTPAPVQRGMTTPVGGYREAPIHRQYPPGRQPSSWSVPASDASGEVNMAGRGSGFKRQ